jgi:hypothetical protein
MDFSICFPKKTHTHTHTHTKNEEDRGLQLERGLEILHRWYMHKNISKEKNDGYGLVRW